MLGFWGPGGVKPGTFWEVGQRFYHCTTIAPKVEVEPWTMNNMLLSLQWAVTVQPPSTSTFILLLFWNYFKQYNHRYTKYFQAGDSKKSITLFTKYPCLGTDVRSHWWLVHYYKSHGSESAGNNLIVYKQGLEKELPTTGIKQLQPHPPTPHPYSLHPPGRTPNESRLRKTTDNDAAVGENYPWEEWVPQPWQHTLRLKDWGSVRFRSVLGAVFQVWTESGFSSQQQVQKSFSGFFLFRTLKEPLCAAAFTDEWFFWRFSLAASANTMSSTSSCWYEPLLLALCPFTHLSGGFLADVSKNIIPWTLAKLIACSWPTCSRVLLGSRRSPLLPTRNLQNGCEHLYKTQTHNTQLPFGYCFDCAQKMDRERNVNWKLTAE